MMSKIRIIHLIFSMKFINAIYVTIVMQSRQKMLHIIHTHKKIQKIKLSYTCILHTCMHTGAYMMCVCIHSFIHSFYSIQSTIEAHLLIERTMSKHSEI